MGLHPDTQGYYTAKDQGFEYTDKLPDLPAWLMNAIINKNAKQGIPSNQHTRIVGPGFALNARVNLERDMQLATEAMWALPPEATDDYDIWITIGQSLHSWMTLYWKNGTSGLSNPINIVRETVRNVGYHLAKEEAEELGH